MVKKRRISVVCYQPVVLVNQKILRIVLETFTLKSRLFWFMLPILGGYILLFIWHFEVSSKVVISYSEPWTFKWSFDSTPDSFKSTRQEVRDVLKYFNHSTQPACNRFFDWVNQTSYAATTPYRWFWFCRGMHAKIKSDRERSYERGIRCDITYVLTVMGI